MNVVACSTRMLLLAHFASLKRAVSRVTVNSSHNFNAALIIEIPHRMLFRNTRRERTLLLIDVSTLSQCASWQITVVGLVFSWLFFYYFLNATLLPSRQMVSDVQFGCHRAVYSTFTVVNKIVPIIDSQQSLHQVPGTRYFFLCSAAYGDIKEKNYAQ